MPAGEHPPAAAISMSSPIGHLRIAMALLAVVAGLVLPAAAAQAATPAPPVPTVQSPVATATESVGRTAAPVVKQVRQVTDRPAARIQQRRQGSERQSSRRERPRHGVGRDRPRRGPLRPHPPRHVRHPRRADRVPSGRQPRSEQRTSPQRRARSQRPEPAKHAHKAVHLAVPPAVERPRGAAVSSETAFPSDDTSPLGTGAGGAVASSAAAAVGSFAISLAGLCFLIARRPRGRRLSLASTPCTSALLFAAVERPG